MRAPSSVASSRPPVDRSAERLRLRAFVSLLEFRSRPYAAEKHAEGRGAFAKGILRLREDSEQRGGSYDGPREVQRLGLGRQDPRGVDRAGGNDRDHGGPLKRSACLCPRLPGGRQRAGRRHASYAPPRSKPVLPLLLPVERGWLDTPCRGGRAGGSRSSRLLLLDGTLFTGVRGKREILRSSRYQANHLAPRQALDNDIASPLRRRKAVATACVKTIEPACNTRPART